MLKIRGSEVQQAILEAIVDAIGPGTGLPFEPNVITGELSMTLADSEIVSRLLYEHLHSRATSIYGGSNEIQRHIIAKSLLSQ
jgi:alkylation response protein AidB-like acyl-CoA dehydrogenase